MVTPSIPDVPHRARQRQQPPSVRDKRLPTGVSRRYEFVVRGQEVADLGDRIGTLFPAAGNPVGRYLSHQFATGGESFVAVCLRTADAADVAERTGSSPVRGPRTWKGSSGRALMHGLPLFITWAFDSDRPACIPVEQPSGASGIAWVEVGGDPDRVRAWVGSDEAQLRPVERSPVCGGSPWRRLSQRSCSTGTNDTEPAIALTLAVTYVTT